MADPNDPQETMEDLQAEITRLQNELEQTAHDKMQAAEYGLAVLEEKQHLQLQFEELEALYDTTRTELDCAKQVTLFKYIPTLFLIHFWPTGNVWQSCLLKFNNGGGGGGVRHK